MHGRSMDQQRGGLGAIGGSGETFIETRFRLLQEREKKIHEALKRLSARRHLLKKNRKRHQLPTIAIVGYTNAGMGGMLEHCAVRLCDWWLAAAGKTSLIKALTGDQSMQPKDQVFATLDVTVHAGFLPNNMKVLYIDTVGFISSIPTELIASFSATLEDMLDAVSLMF